MPEAESTAERAITLLAEPPAGRGIYKALAGPVRNEELLVYAEVGNHTLDHPWQWIASTWILRPGQ